MASNVPSAGDVAHSFSLVRNVA